MDMKWKSSVQRVTALVLCMAMLLTMAPMAVRAEESSSGFTEITDELFNAVGQADVLTMAEGIALPAYSTAEGTVSQVMAYDCGNGVARDGSKSYMAMVTGTTAQEFAAYCGTLADAYTLTYENTVAGRGTQQNLFRKYVAEDGAYAVYTYFLEAYGETRIIVDTQADTVAGFSYVSETGETAVPMIAQYGLSMSENGYDITTTTEYATGKRN